jgi:hypothetical protein
MGSESVICESVRVTIISKSQFVKLFKVSFLNLSCDKSTAPGTISFTSKLSSVPAVLFDYLK